MVRGKGNFPSPSSKDSYRPKLESLQLKSDMMGAWGLAFLFLLSQPVDGTTLCVASGPRASRMPIWPRVFLWFLRRPIQPKR